MTVKVCWNNRSRQQVRDWLREKLGNRELSQLRQVTHLDEAYLENVVPARDAPQLGLHRFGIF